MPAHAADPRAGKPDRRAQLPAAHYRVGWLVLLGVIVLAEVVALFTKEALDVLSATMWWALGPQYGPRWWFIGLPVTAVLTWAGPHFLYPEVGARVLLVMLALALLVATAGWAVTR